MFWNARSKKLNELHHLSNVDILICVESWRLSISDNIHFPGFLIFRKDKLNSRCGNILILFFLKQIAKKSPNRSVEIWVVHIMNLIIPLDLAVYYRISIGSILYGGTLYDDCTKSNHD